jgi:hypothetical protein
MRWLVLALLLFAVPVNAQPPVYTFAGRMSPFSLNPATCGDGPTRFEGGGWMEGWYICDPLPGDTLGPDTLMCPQVYEFTEPDTLYHPFSYRPHRSGYYRHAIDVASMWGGWFSDYCPLEYGEAVKIVLPAKASTWILNRGR